MKYIYFVLGWLFFSLGVVGIFLPVLPTTPFMILALWFFSKSSEKFHHWLYHHRLFGPSLKLWDNYRVIPLFAKIVALGFMAISMSFMAVSSSIDNWFKVMAGVFMLSAAIYILGKPSKPPVDEDISTRKGSVS